MVEALGFQSDGTFAVQLSDGSVISVPEEDLIGLASVCRYADLFVKPKPEPENPYKCGCCNPPFGDAAPDAHVRDITGEE